METSIFWNFYRSESKKLSDIILSLINKDRIGRLKPWLTRFIIYSRFILTKFIYKIIRPRNSL
jgi:hypothetical protein